MTHASNSDRTETRRERLARELRENLKRRKGRQRGEDARKAEKPAKQER